MAIIVDRSYSCDITLAAEKQPDTERIILYPGSTSGAVFSSFDIAHTRESRGNVFIRLGVNRQTDQRQFQSVVNIIDANYDTDNPSESNYVFINEGSTDSVQQIRSVAKTFADARRTGGFFTSYAGVEFQIEKRLTTADDDLDVVYIITSPGRMDSDGTVQALIPGQPGPDAKQTKPGTIKVVDFLYLGAEPSRRSNITIGDDTRSVLIAGEPPLEAVEGIVYGLDANAFERAREIMFDGKLFRIAEAQQLAANQRIVHLLRDIEDA